MNIDKIGLQKKKKQKKKLQSPNTKQQAEKNLKKLLHKVQDCNNKNFE